MTDESVDTARAYLEVRIEWQHDGRFWLGARNLFGLLMDAATWGVLGGVAQARSTVKVIRKRDGKVVAQFEHTDNVQAMDQVNDLRDFIENQSIHDVCAQLGLAATDI